MRVTAPFSQAYLYFWLESDEIMDEMRNRGTGVAVPGLNSTALSGVSISIPPEKLLLEFSNFVEQLVSKIFANAKESRTLANLRDSLLPKLMRGEVRVK
jgi:type I restriction enzyme, S subunit